MKTLIHITGVQYDCTKADVAAVMAEMEQEKPEVLLVAEQTDEFGTVVHALKGTVQRGVVNRFDLTRVQEMMQRDGVQVLVGRVAETDAEGRCYTVCIEGDYPTPEPPGGNTPDQWESWQWTGAPLLGCSPDDRRLDISLKVATAQLACGKSMNRQTLLEHLAVVLQLAKWDVSRETQEQLHRIWQMAGSHEGHDVKALAPKFRHTLTAMGSKKRTREFHDIFLPALCQSKQAATMRKQWYDMHKAELDDISRWQPAVARQLEAVENCLAQLPADLCYQKDQFGALMHRLLYMSIPRRKLTMLLSALVLRRQLRKMLGLQADEVQDEASQPERLLVQQLSPIFYGDTDSAREFLMVVRGKSASEITTLVNHWLVGKRICPAHCHRPLWTALHQAGIYTATESNWNALLNVRKNMF